jgi:hypothetical protein
MTAHEAAEMEGAALVEALKAAQAAGGETRK